VRPESDFTPPTELCPHPGRWHAHDGMATEAQLKEAFAIVDRGLEITDAVFEG
jgi:hypothetical protein